jgi:hypothetical protein
MGGQLLSAAVTKPPHPYSEKFQCPCPSKEYLSLIILH